MSKACLGRPQGWEQQKQSLPQFLWAENNTMSEQASDCVQHCRDCRYVSTACRGANGLCVADEAREYPPRQRPSKRTESDHRHEEPCPVVKEGATSPRHGRCTIWLVLQMRDEGH